MTNKSKAEITIELVLGQGGCTMISPGYEIKRDEVNFKHEKIEWKKGGKEKLAESISAVMIEKSKQDLNDALNNTSPIIYLDCKEKGSKDIIYFLMENIVKKYKSDETKLTLVKNITKHSMLADEREKLKHYNEHYNGMNFIEDFLEEYHRYFREVIKRLQNDPEAGESAVKRMYDFEMDCMFYIIGETMAAHGGYAYVYIDNSDSLTREERQRVNLLLYTRGKVGGNKAKLDLKINNGLGTWNTRTTSNGQHRAESPHDYSDYTIKEKDLAKPKPSQQ